MIAARDRFDLATVGEGGWPHVQHRGGSTGFLQVLGQATLAFPDYGGNRQFVSVGSLQDNPRVALILMDYANRRRLKILGTLRVHEPARAPVEQWTRVAETGGPVAERLSDPGRT